MARVGAGVEPAILRELFFCACFELVRVCFCWSRQGSSVSTRFWQVREGGDFPFAQGRKLGRLTGVEGWHLALILGPKVVTLILGILGGGSELLVGVFGIHCVCLSRVAVLNLRSAS